MSKLSEALQSGKFEVTGEIGPSKGVVTEEMLELAGLYKGRVVAINVTDQQSAVMRLGSLAVCHLLKDMEIEPIFQITCRDRNRIAIQSDLLGAYVLGVENVLCLTGDYVTLGDHPQAKSVFDLDSVSLLEAVVQLQQGKDLAEKGTSGFPEVFLRCHSYPRCQSLGATDYQDGEKGQSWRTVFSRLRLSYEPEKFEKFMQAVKHLNIPVLAGIILLKSAGMARFMNKNVAGVHVPDNLIEEMEEVEKKGDKSIEIAARLINELKELCQGIHVMPIGWEKRVPAVLDAAGI